MFHCGDSAAFLGAVGAAELAAFPDALEMLRSKAGVWGWPAEAGQGEAVALAGVADHAVQEQAADAFAEGGAAADADQPCGGEAYAPLEAQEGFQLGVGDRGGVVDQMVGEAFGVPPPRAQEA